MNRYFPIDCAKMVMAIMIVALHSMPLFFNASANQYAAWSFDTIVPLFFCFSGFFFAKNTDLKKSLRHLIPLYLFYAVLSWPLSFTVFEGLSLWQAIHKTLFLGTFNVGWFIISLIWCMIITASIDRIKNKAVSYTLLSVISVALYFICLTFVSYHSVFSSGVIKTIQTVTKDVIYVPEWCFMRGLLFFAIGFLVSRSGTYMSRRLALPLLILALASYFTELTLANDAGAEVTSLNFSLPFVIFAALPVFLSFCRPVDDRGLGKRFRQMSTMLYLSHPMIMFLLYRSFGISGGWMRFIPTLMIFAIGFAAYQWLRQKPRFKWLRYAC